MANNNRENRGSDRANKRDQNSRDSNMAGRGAAQTTDRDTARSNPGSRSSDRRDNLR